MTPDALLSFLEVAGYGYRLVSIAGASELTTWPAQGGGTLSFRGSTILEACEMAKRELLPHMDDPEDWKTLVEHNPYPTIKLEK